MAALAKGSWMHSQMVKLADDKGAIIKDSHHGYLHTQVKQFLLSTVKKKIVLVCAGNKCFVRSANWDDRKPSQ